jgi:hypothetical protein
VAQGEGPEFKSQYRTHTHKVSRRNRIIKKKKKDLINLKVQKGEQRELTS